MDKLLSVLPQNGDWMSFPDFMTAARNVGAQPKLWLRAKQSGLIETEVVGNYSETGQLNVRLVVSNGS